MSKPEGALDQIAEYLILGYFRDVTGPNATSIKWSDSEIRVDLSRLDAKGQFLARTALDMWSSATGLAFKEVSIDRDDGRGDNDRGILFQYGPATRATWLKSDSKGWISWNVELRKSTQSNAVGTNESGEYTVIGPRALDHFIHEIGHALGLGNPGNYNGSVSYQGDAKFANDSVQISAMSYFGPTENPTLKASLALPATPMSADILAIEKLYGDSNAMRTGDTVYGFNSTAGGFLDDLAGHMNAGRIFSFTLIDDGGNDSFDYSGASHGSRVDFNPGAVSDVFGRKGNMVIYKDTVIEHFIGGGGTDNVTGNDANNMLFGGAGDDTLDGGAGDDILIGGIGADTLTGGGGSDTFRYTSGTFGADTIADFEDGSDIIDLGGAGLQFTDLTISDRSLWTRSSMRAPAIPSPLPGRRAPPWMRPTSPLPAGHFKFPLKMQASRKAASRALFCACRSCPTQLSAWTGARRMALPSLARISLVSAHGGLLPSRRVSLPSALRCRHPTMMCSSPMRPSAFNSAIRWARQSVMTRATR